MFSPSIETTKKSEARASVLFDTYYAGRGKCCGSIIRIDETRMHGLTAMGFVRIFVFFSLFQIQNNFYLAIITIIKRNGNFMLFASFVFFFLFHFILFYYCLLLTTIMHNKYCIVRCLQHSPAHITKVRI